MNYKKTFLNLVLTLLFLTLLIIPAAFSWFLLLVDSPFISLFPQRRILGVTRSGDLKAFNFFSSPEETVVYRDISYLRNPGPASRTYGLKILSLRGDGVENLRLELFFSLSGESEITLSPGQKTTVSLRVSNFSSRVLTNASSYTLEYITYLATP